MKNLARNAGNAKTGAHVWVVEYESMGDWIPSISLPYAFGSRLTAASAVRQLNRSTKTVLEYRIRKYVRQP